MYMVSTIKEKITIDDVKNIFGNKNNAVGFLNTINILNNKTLKNIDVFQLVVDNWNYDKALLYARKVFKNTDKYQRSLDSAYKMKLAIKEWQELDLGEIKWPYKATNFDQYIRKINSLLEKTSLEKDNQVMEAVKKFRRIKEINMLRNDYIESLLVEFNNFIMPTLSNRKGVDFYIDGVLFDQKVSKSVTEQFKTDYKEDYKKVALTNPEIVAKYLYMYQDEERFDAGPRLYVVYLNEDINPDEIRYLIKNVNFKKSIPISFSFDHSKTGKKEYNTICQIIILSRR